MRSDNDIMLLEKVDTEITILAMDAGLSVHYNHPKSDMEAIWYTFSRTVEGKEFCLNKVIPLYEIRNAPKGYCKMIIREVTDEFKARGLA